MEGTGVHDLGVRLCNDGPGVAFDVRFSVEPVEDEVLRYVIPPIRAVRSGEVVPPHPEPQEHPIRGDDEYVVAGPTDLSRLAWVTVRYADALGRAWEVRAPLDPHRRLAAPRRLRSAPWRRGVRW
jgi:hypothetical protein